MSPETRGYTATKEQLVKRLRRIEGQVRGVAEHGRGRALLHRHPEPDRAVEAALDKVALGLLDDHAQHCVTGAEAPTSRDDQELMAAVGRLMHRG